jgi:glycine/D-amino acid oxidase-like deaminating enzyme
VRVPFGPLTRDIDADVLIIGAGITGAMIADALAAAGSRVVVIDRRGLAKGSTTASTALVLYEIDTPLIKLTHKIGKNNAIRAWRRSRLAVDALAARFQELDFRNVARRDSLYLAGNMLDRDALWREHLARRSAGLACRFLGRSELRERFGIRRNAALLGFGNLAIDPRQAAMALLKASVGNGAAVHAPVEIVDVAPKRSGVELTTKGARTLRCGRLVFATGYELPHGVPRKRHRVTATWAIATARQQARNLWDGECMIWEASDPYLYIRTTTERRVIIGGEDESIADDAERVALLPVKTRALQQKLRRLMPKLDPTVEFAWTGAFGETTTGLPIIGEVPGMPNCWVALGYGGNGITYASIAADLITGALSGRPDADADLYAFR